MPSERSTIDVEDLERRLDELRALAQKQDPTDAIYACDKFNRDYPVSGQGWSIASQLAIRINDVAAAIRAIDYALGIDAERPEWLLQKANCLLLSGRLADAQTLAARLSARLYPSAQMSSAIGLLLAQLNMHEEALVLFADAVKQEPDAAGHYYNLATVQRYLGKLENAEASLDQAVTLDPTDTDALALRSALRRQTTADNHVADLKRTLDRPDNTPRATVSICHAVAKELEDLGEFSESFRFLAKGANCRRQHIKYAIDGDLETMAQIQSVFDQDRFACVNIGHVDAKPIFVFGMPRTGTTLVERILGCHSVVKAAGELNNFALQLTNIARASAPSPIRTRADLVTAAGSLDTALLGRAYVDSCQPIVRDHAHYVDKMPMNFLYAGLIHLALPKAAIIHVVRDPMDTCYAVYKTLFEGAYPYSYKLDELANYFVAYHQLMAHWDRVMPDVMLQIRYEDLVTGAETQIQDLLDYCGLSWEQQCLDSHQSGGYSTTASAAQIRRPIHQESIGRWKYFEKELRTVADILTEAGITVQAQV